MSEEPHLPAEMTEDEVLRAEYEVYKRAHRELDELIVKLEQGPAPDVIAVRRLKREKLRLKDRAEAIFDRLNPDIIA